MRQVHEGGGAGMGENIPYEKKNGYETLELLAQKF